jgi:hypothetical protein
MQVTVVIKVTVTIMVPVTKPPVFVNVTQIGNYQTAQPVYIYIDMQFVFNVNIS